MNWLKHAFAVEPPGPAEPTPEQRVIVDRICREIVRRHMTTPALLMLEMSRPLNYVGSQAMHFFSPLINTLTDARGHEHFAAFLEQRGSIEFLCRQIERWEDEAAAGRKPPQPSDNAPPENVPPEGPPTDVSASATLPAPSGMATADDTVVPPTAGDDDDSKSSC